MKSAGEKMRVRREAFTLAEVVISIGIAALLFIGTIGAYIQTCRRAEWSGYSLAAQSLAIQQLEQARSALWDPADVPVKNELTQLMASLISWTSNASGMAGYSWTNLDLPISGNNTVRATNFVRLRSISLTNVPVTVQMVQVDTVWPFLVGGTTRLFTNTVANYFAPDNPEQP